MDFKENIDYRRSLEGKVFAKQKLTSDEKFWLLSTPRYNERFSFPCLQRDIIHIPANSEIRLDISVVSSKDRTKIYRPVIGVVGKGKITVKNELLNIDMSPCDKKETSLLVPLFDENRHTVSVSATSKVGSISVAYECEYYDERMKATICEISDGAKLSYGMKKYSESENETVYFCKAPSIHDDDFEAFVFSITVNP